MFHPVVLFRSLGIIEPIQCADQVTSDPAYTLEVNAFPYKRVHRASFVHGLYLKLGGSCFFSFFERQEERQCSFSQKKSASTILRGHCRFPSLYQRQQREESVSSA